MKAKKLIGMIAFASACVSLSAFANTTNDWFGVTVENSIVDHSCIVWNNVGTPSGTQISLEDVKQNSALVFTPEGGSVTNCADDIYVISASVALTPCSTNDFKDANVGDAKAGIVVGFDENNVTSYYGYASGALDKWVKLAGAAVVNPGQDTIFAIVLNYRDSKVNFMIREIVEESPVDKWFGPYDMAGGTSALLNIKAWGTGSISSVIGGFEVAEAEYGGNKYGSVADAMAVAGSANYDSIAVVDDSGEVKTTDPDENGQKPWENKAMGVEADAQVGLSKVATTKQNSGMITLGALLPNKEENVDVKFEVYCGDAKVGGPYAQDDIQIPMGDPGSNTYTIKPVVSIKSE